MRLGLALVSALVPAIVLALAACREAKPDLAHQLEADAQAAHPRVMLDGWELPRPVWERVVVPPFRLLYDDYIAEFGAQMSNTRAHLQHVEPPYAIRPHFAGDPKLTLDEAVTRWIVPTMYPSQVVDGIDAVFVEDNGRYYALVGMAAVLQKKLEPPCQALLAKVGPKSACGEAMWQHVVDTLKGNVDAAAHSCRLAQGLCGT